MMMMKTMTALMKTTFLEREAVREAVRATVVVVDVVGATTASVSWTRAE
jgi:hypothetical protein